MKPDSSTTKHFKEKEITEILQEYRQSGLSQKSFCKRKGIKHGTLFYWLYQKGKPRKRSSSKQKQQWVEVHPTQLTGNPGDYEIELTGGCLIRVKSGFDFQETKRLIQATREACSQ